MIRLSLGTLGTANDILSGSLFFLSFFLFFFPFFFFNAHFSTFPRPRVTRGKDRGATKPTWIDVKSLAYLFSAFAIQ